MLDENQFHDEAGQRSVASQQIHGRSRSFRVAPQLDDSVEERSDEGKEVP